MVNDMFREFTKDDWDCFEEAKPFGKTRQPLIAECGPVIVLLDKQGIWVIYNEEDGYGVELKDQRTYKIAIMSTFLKAIENQPPEFILNKLEEYGFELI